MIDFLEYYFRMLVLSASAIYIVLGIILIKFKVPNNADYAPYRLSKKLLACAFWVVSLNIYIWDHCFNGDWHNPSSLVACFDIILYYLIGILFSYSFSNLLDRQYLNKRRVIIDFSKWGVCSAIALIAMLDALKAYQQWLLLLALAFLLEFFLRFFHHFRQTYARSGELFDNYFSTDKRHFIIWIRKSISFIYILGFLAVLTINTGVIANWLFQVYIISLNVYITISFINYAVEYGNLQKADEKVIDKEEGQESTYASTLATKGQPSKKAIENIEGQLKPRIMAWIKTKKYMTEQFNIEDLATLLYTNKYYLSRYIKENYKMNFSTWIASLRITEAKRMMQESPDVKLEDIALAVGFSSLSYFSKVFSRLEGTTPSLWLKNISR